MGALEVVKPGHYTTVQDAGRWAAAFYGIPSGGYMDRHAAQLANVILNNSLQSAVLECMFSAPKSFFSHQPMWL